MAYARRRSTRRSRASYSPRRQVRRRSTARRTVSRRRAPARKRSRSSGRSGGVVRIEVVQRPLETNPLATALSETKKEVKPRRARI